VRQTWDEKQWFVANPIRSHIPNRRQTCQLLGFNSSINAINAYVHPGSTGLGIVVSMSDADKVQNELSSLDPPL